MHTSRAPSCALEHRGEEKKMEKDVAQNFNPISYIRGYQAPNV